MVRTRERKRKKNVKETNYGYDLKIKFDDGWSSMNSSSSYLNNEWQID